jgi:two-component system, cell cycle sensor histidine kinase and response regulator CckA
MNTRPRILIVDDIEANRDTLIEFLDTGEYDLDEAETGSEALDRAMETPPDLVLLDVMMPGMDGYEVCRRMRADSRLGEVPILMLTALDDADSRLSGIEAGADDFISKPFNQAELRARVRTITRLNRYRRLMDAQERIREQARWLDEAGDAIFVRDLQDRISYWNHGATRVFGWTAGEALGQAASGLLHEPDAPFPPEGLRTVSTRGEWQGEVVHVAKGGREILVDCRLTLLRDRGGAARAILAINTDITEKRRIEQRMLRTQRLESIGTLASGIAHDLNNSLAPILLGIELLRDEHPDEPMLNTMEASAERGSEMLNHLLAFAKGIEGSRQTVHSSHLFKEMERMITGTFPSSIKLQVHVSADLEPIRADPTQMHQVLLNLCVNARDAMEDGGVLSLRAENVDVQPSEVGTEPHARPGRHVVWQISDTGTGISPEALERIFEPFFTTKGPEKGTGLGLSTSFGIVRSHGGFIRISSTVGKGTTFSVYLPALGTTGGGPDPAHPTAGESSVDTVGAVH